MGKKPHPNRPPKKQSITYTIYCNGQNNTWSNNDNNVDQGGKLIIKADSDTGQGVDVWGFDNSIFENNGHHCSPPPAQNKSHHIPAGGTYTLCLKTDNINTELTYSFSIDYLSPTCSGDNEPPDFTVDG